MRAAGALFPGARATVLDHPRGGGRAGVGVQSRSCTASSAPRRWCAISRTPSRPRRRTSASKRWCSTSAAWPAAASRSWRKLHARDPRLPHERQEGLSRTAKVSTRRSTTSPRRPTRSISIRRASPHRRLRLLPHVPQGPDRQAGGRRQRVPRRQVQVVHRPVQPQRHGRQEEEESLGVAQLALVAVPGRRGQGARASADEGAIADYANNFAAPPKNSVATSRPSRSPRDW